MAQEEPSRLRPRGEPLGRAFRFVWTAGTVSAFGSAVTPFALSVLVVQTLHGGATEVGLVSAARWLAYPLLGVVAGVLVDRLARRPTLLATDLGLAVVLGTVPLLAALDRLDLPSLLLLVAAFGLLTLVNDAAGQALLPRVVPMRLLTRAHGRIDQGAAVAQTAGPALGGAVVARLGAPAALLLDAVSYLASAAVLLAARVPEPPTVRASLGAVGREAIEGLRWVYRRGPLRALALDTHAWFVCWAVTGAVLTPFALRTVRLGPLVLGLALTAAGVGTLLGSLAAARLGDRIGAGRTIVAGRAGSAVGWAVVALTPPGGPAVLLVGQLVVGIAMGLENANEMAYRQSVTPDRLQGRVNATMRSINRTALVIAAPVGGLLGDGLGYRPLLWAAVAGFLLVALALALSGFRTERLADA